MKVEQLPKKYEVGKEWVVLSHTTQLGIWSFYFGPSGLYFAPHAS